MRSISRFALASCLAVIGASGCAGDDGRENDGEKGAASDLEEYCSEAAGDDFCRELEGDAEQAEDDSSPEHREPNGDQAFVLDKIRGIVPL